MSQYHAGYDPAYPSGGEPARTSLLCVSALVSSAIFCCPLASLLGVLLGIGGMISVSSSNGRRKGSGLAFAAIALGILAIIAQFAAVRIFWPQLRSWVESGVQLATGPSELLRDLELGDYQSARTHLYSATEQQIKDGQLRYFKEQVVARYGSFQQWQPPAGQGFEFSGAGEWPHVYRGTILFSNGAQQVTLELTLKVSQTIVIEETGISRLTIHDPARGDLTLDPSTPEAEDAPGEGGGGG